MERTGAGRLKKIKKLKCNHCFYHFPDYISPHNVIIWTKIGRRRKGSNPQHYRILSQIEMRNFLFVMQSGTFFFKYILISFPLGFPKRDVHLSEDKFCLSVCYSISLTPPGSTVGGNSVWHNTLKIMNQRKPAICSSRKYLQFPRKMHFQSSSLSGQCT